MALHDEHDLSTSGATPAALEHYHRALALLRCYVGDPVAEVNAALATSPGFVMGHALKGWLHLLGTEPGALGTAGEALDAGRKLPANARETAHLTAIENVLAGRWHAASRVLEDLSIDEPRDALALQAGHSIDFFTGNSRMLRDRIARALPAWSESMPAYHAVLGMHAFGLEEMGDYARAESAGRRAIELEQRDGWAQHAVAHVMEMQGRPREGLAWMLANPNAWTHESFFCVHNWWHVALYHLELGEHAEALALLDGPILGAGSSVILDMIDASAMLWRLELRGVDVGPRWEALADRWTPLATAGNYAFNDVHAMMAFARAGRTAAAIALLESQQAAMGRGDDNALFTRDVGHPLTLAIAAFVRGEYTVAIDLLRKVRGVAARFGGSHAQRDMIDQTLIEAALRADSHALAAALISERIEAKPTSASARALGARLLQQAA